MGRIIEVAPQPIGRHSGPSQPAMAIILLGVVGVVGYSEGWAEPGPDSGRPHLAQISRDDHAGSIRSLAFSPTGAALASASVTGDVRLRSLAIGRSTRLGGGPMRSSRSLTFSPDGAVLAISGADSTVRILNAGTGESLDSIDAGGGVVKCVAFSPDGTLLAVGEEWDGAVTLWDWPGRRRLRALSGHVGGINALAFSADGSRLASGDTDGSVRLWDVATGRPIAGPPPQDRPIMALAFWPTGDRLATLAFLDKAVRLWDASGGASPRALAARSTVHAFAISTDGRSMVMAGEGGIVTVVDVASGRERGSLGLGESSFYSVALSADGRTLATGAADGSVRLWDLAKALGAAVDPGR